MKFFSNCSVCFFCLPVHPCIFAKVHKNFIMFMMQSILAQLVETTPVSSMSPGRLDGNGQEPGGKAQVEKAGFL